jgi:membrane-associated phospholipid phosphatase
VTLTAFAVLVVAALAAVLLLHRLAWMGVRLLIGSARRLTPGMRGVGNWALAHPLHAWFLRRHPRLHAIARARLSPHAFSGLPLTLMTAAAIYVAALFGGVVEDLLMTEGIVAFDQSINAFFGPYRVDPLLPVVLWVTALGGGPAITAVAIAATGLLWAARRRYVLASLWIALLGAEATSTLGKYLVGRARPEFLDVAKAWTPSFPSGHSTASMAVYGFLAYVIARDLPGLRRRFEVTFWTILLIALVGFSRIFLSVHYASDVLSGFLVGGFWLLVAIAVAEWTRAPR